MTFVTIKTFDNAMSAHILKASLEGNGIPCYLFDENIVTTNPLYTNLVGGIKLKVAAPDEQAALEVLKAIEETPYTDNDDHVIRCPNCQSTNIISGLQSAKGWLPKLWFFVAIAIGIYPLNHNRVYHCKECDTEFK